MDIKQYFYFWGILIFVPVWIIIFLKKTSRKDLILTGILAGVVAFLIARIYATVDYWHPVYLIPSIPFEDFLYGFIFGGIAAEIYEIISKKENTLKTIYPKRLGLIFLFGIIIISGCLIIVNLLRFNSIVAHIVPSMLIAIIIGIYRRDLIKSMLVSAVVMVLLTFLMFVVVLYFYPEAITNHWYMRNLSQVLVFGVPIEEYLFAIVVGSMASSWYEAVFGYGQVRSKKVSAVFPRSRKRA